MLRHAGVVEAVDGGIQGEGLVVFLVDLAGLAGELRIGAVSYNFG